MSRLFRFTASSPEAYQHYIDTIERGFKLDTIRKFLTEDQAAALHNLYGDGLIRAWGAVPGKGNMGTWKQMTVGDPVLVYRKKNFEYYAFVTFKLHNPDLARFLWGQNSEGQTWEYAYFMDQLSDISVPLKIFNELVGYKANFIPQGFALIDEKKTAALAEKYGSINAFLNYLSEGKWIEKDPAIPSPIKEQVIQERIARHIGNTIILEANLENLMMDRVGDLEKGLHIVGRQVDTQEVGRLDLLCEDAKGDLVVVELKKAAAGSSIIDQTQRYMGWAKAKRAKPGQGVRGIIVVGSKDTALEYAVSANPMVTVKEFNLSFK